MSTALAPAPVRLRRLSAVPPVRSTPRPVVRPAIQPQPAADLEPAFRDPLVLYGDFNCPWSYLAFRRAAVLAASGVQVDWRAVEHDFRPPRRGEDRESEVVALREEMDRVAALLLPGERLPYDLAGFVPRTRASIAAYAEGYAADVAGPVRRVLFEAFWMHGIDIGDARVLRTLLVDELRSGTSPSEAVREWGYGVDVTGGPISTSAWRLVRDWAQTWRDTSDPAALYVPLLVVPGCGALAGVDAVTWLGEAISARSLDLEPPADPVDSAPACPDLPHITWVSTQGGAWLRRCEQRKERGW